MFASERAELTRLLVGLRHSDPSGAALGEWVTDRLDGYAGRYGLSPGERARQRAHRRVFGFFDPFSQKQALHPLTGRRGGG